MVDYLLQGIVAACLGIFIGGCICIMASPWPLRCHFGFHKWSRLVTRGRPGMHIDLKTNKLCATQSYYRHCRDCPTVVLDRIDNVN